MARFNRARYLHYDGMEVRCHCGQRAPRMTSWTEENPGRRFFCCVKEESEGGCLFWRWADPKFVNPRYCSLILELHEENQRLMSAVEELRFGWDVSGRPNVAETGVAGSSKANTWRRKMSLFVLGLVLILIVKQLIGKSIGVDDNTALPDYS